MSEAIKSSRVDGFSLVEILVVVLIISGMGTLARKNTPLNPIAIQKASATLEIAQNKINDAVFESYINARPVDPETITDAINNIQEANSLFSLESQGKHLILRIGKQSLKMTIVNRGHTISITCNPNKPLCRKLKGRKHSK